MFPKIHLWCYTCQLLGDRRAASHFPTCMCRGGTWLRFECAIARTEDERATIVPATRLIDVVILNSGQRCFFVFAHFERNFMKY